MCQNAVVYLAALQVLAASDASVALRWLKDGQGVVSQEVGQHKFALPAHKRTQHEHAS